MRPGGFYGWPWFYLGNHVDPRHKGKHADLANKVIFYTGEQFPAEYRGDIFAAFHGSWNRTRRTGYKNAKDGSLLFSEDGNDTIWRVSYGK